MIDHRTRPTTVYITAHLLKSSVQPPQPVNQSDNPRCYQAAQRYKTLVLAHPAE
jgi:hypothetical protein